MLEIVAAERADLLCEALLDELERERAGADPVAALFSGPVVLAPSHEAELLLARRLAERRGGVVNLRCLGPAAFLRELAAAAPEPVTLLDRALLERWLQRLLARALHDPSRVAPAVARYLERPGRGARAVALAARLARALDDALAQDLLPGRAPAAEPDWLHALLAQALGPDGAATLAEPGARVLPLSQAFTEIDLGALALPPALHGYCLPPPPPALRRALAALARRIPVRLFLQDPSRALPADGPRDDVRARIARRWCNAMTATCAALVEETGASLRSLATPHDGAAAGRGPAAAPDRAAPITVLRAPSRRRELEAIAASIWHEVERGANARPPLRLSDVAVLIPPGRFDELTPELSAVLRAADLPFRLVGAPLAAASPAVDALLALAALPGCDGSREAILSFLVREPVLAAAGVSDSQAWVALCEGLGIVRGIAAEDLRDTYLADDDRLSWEHGLARLALGRFADGPASGDERPVLARGRPMLPADLPFDLPPATLAFARVARRTLDWMRTQRAASLPLGEWLHRLDDAAGELLAGIDPLDQRALELARARLRALATPPWAEPLDHALASAIVARALRGLTTTLRHDAGGEGVLVASPDLARGRAFRVVFVAGLDAGTFPGSDQADELALRAPDGPGGPSARELDQGLFAELLQDARDAIYLSYLARDEATGETREPASLVRECALAWPERVRFEAPPLARHADELARRYLDGAAREAHAWEAGRDAREAADLPRAPAALRARARPALRARLAPVLGPVLAPLPATAAAPAATSASAAALPLRRLIDFLRCPLQGSVRLRLSLTAQDDDETGALQVGDEPLALDRALARELPQRAFALAVRRAAGSGREVPDDDALDEAWRDCAEPARLAGRLPAGPFEASTRAAQLALLRAWRDGFAQLAPRLDRAPRVLALGAAEPGVQVDELLPPATLPASPRAEAGTHPLGGALALHHRTGLWLSFADGATGTLVLRDGPWRGSTPSVEERLRAGLGAFADLLVSALAGRAASRHEIVFVTPGKTGPSPHALPVPSPEAARLYLRELLDEALFDSHDYLLPVEAVCQRFDKPIPVPQLVARLLENPWGSLASRYGPVLDYASYPPPDDAVALHMMRRRFAPYAADREPPALPAR